MPRSSAACASPAPVVACRALLIGAAAVAVLLLAPASRAWAQTSNACPTDGGTMMLPPDYGTVVSNFPALNATGVPLDGFVRLRFLGPVPRPPVAILTDANGTEVPGDVSIIPWPSGEEMHFQARQPLQPNTQYTLTYRDVNSGGNTVTFTTGTLFTTGDRPVFGGIDTSDGAISHSLNGSSDICGDPNAVTITVQWRRAQSNNWPASDIEYVIYQTAGPGIGAPVERARERLFDPNGNCPSHDDRECRSFRLPSSAAGGQVCFNIQAIDAYGRNDGNTVEACHDPTQGNYWTGLACNTAAPVGAPAASLVPPRRGRSGGWIGLGSALALLAVGLAWRVRRGGR